MTTKTQTVKEKPATKVKATTSKRKSAKTNTSASAKTAKTRRRTPANRGKVQESPKPEKAAPNVELGRRGENAAASFLNRRGYTVLKRNWTCPAGEADIIARDGSAIVFIEVKTRSGAEKGLPSEAVGKQKREKYEKIAAMYLQDIDDVDVQVRFDVISILVIAKDRALLRHHVNAFGIA